MIGSPLPIAGRIQARDPKLVHQRTSPADHRTGSCIDIDRCCKRQTPGGKPVACRTVGIPAEGRRVYELPWAGLRFEPDICTVETLAPQRFVNCALLRISAHINPIVMALSQLVYE